MKRVAFYLIAHQPRRLRLPAIPLRGLSPEEADQALWDDALNRTYLLRAADRSYRKTLSFLQTGELPVGLGVTDALTWQLERWAPDLLSLLDALPPSVERIGTSPRHGFLFLLDLPLFRDAMAKKGFPTADTTEMWTSPGTLRALKEAGVRTTLGDTPPHLGLPRPSPLVRSTEAGVRLLLRHRHLSDDVGYRFSDRSSPIWPLTAESYARRIREAPEEEGLIAWDFETFGEHHRTETGIFDFLRALPKALAREGIEVFLPGELPGEGTPLPVTEAWTWAGTGDPDFFFGNAPQRQLFRLLQDAWGVAALSHQEEWALWLTQSDTFHVLQWYRSRGPLAGVSAYFTPDPWWELGAEGIRAGILQAYKNALSWLIEGASKMEGTGTGKAFFP